MAGEKGATLAADGEKGAAATKTGENEAAAAAAKEVAGGKMITLLSLSEDGTPFKVSEAAARLSNLLNTMLEGNDVIIDSGIPLPPVGAAALEKVVEYLTKHAEAAADPYSTSKELKEWDAEFVDGLGSQDALFDLVVAANFLQIDSLLDLTCKKIADMMKGKTNEQIRATFNIPDDLTEEEREKIRREHAWAFPGHRAAAADTEDEDEEEEDEDEGEGEDEDEEP